MSLAAPVLLSEEHELGGFASGHPILDEWLRRRALPNQSSGATRTFVVPEASRVVAYYALASGAIASADATGRFRRNMPDPVPVVILARLAVASDHQGKGVGRALVRDAARRVVAASEVVGLRGLLVHAVDETARAFYVTVGFSPSPTQPMTLMIALSDLRASL